MHVHYFSLFQSLFVHIQACLWEIGKTRGLIQDPCEFERRNKTVLRSVEACSAARCQGEVVVANLDGTLTRSRRPFPYYMLVAFEAGSPMRALLLLICSPFIYVLQLLVSEALGIRLLIFISTAGLRASDVEGVGRAVLCRFYLQDLNPSAYKVFVACSTRYVVTASPRIMVEPFLKDFLGAEHVIGTELHTVKGFCTGMVRSPGVLVGLKKRDALRAALKEQQQLDVGMGDQPSDYAFLSLCKEAYMVTQHQHFHAVPKEQYLKPLIFHDGRLVKRPTELNSLFIFLWFPAGLLLALIRMAVWVTLPFKIALPLSAALGVRIRVRGSTRLSPDLLPDAPHDDNNKGVLYVCTHKTVMDGLVLSMAMQKKAAVAIYSVSRLVEACTPIKTVRLERDRDRDANAMRRVLQKQDLIICPEGTTCREPYLLRFSPLFAELSNNIVPVGLDLHQSLFHGSTARGNKVMDPLFFFMNPSPMYSVNILKPLPREETCAAGKSALDVANQIQKTLGRIMGYECTQFTRKHKYQILAGNDGIDPSSKSCGR